MLIGFDHRTIAHRGLTPGETLELACQRRLDGVQFPEPAAIDPELDPARLERFRDRAEAMGLYLEVGLPSPNPVARSRREDRPIAPKEHARDLARHLEAVAALGCRHARACVGDCHTRFHADPGWLAEQNATLEVLSVLRPLLRSMHLRIALETHADLTVDEMLRLVEAAGTDIAGVTLDTGNLVMRLDEPIEAAQRLAPVVLGVHVKDAVLGFTERGLCWQVRSVGSGVLPITEILARVEAANPGVNLSIELHPQTCELAIFDRSWLAFFPELRPESLAAVVRLAAECERRYATGTLERPEDVEAVPWDRRDLDWLARSAGYLRPIADLLGSL